MQIDYLILKELYTLKNNNEFYDVSKFKKLLRFKKLKVDNVVIDMENNGYLEKKYPGQMSQSMIPEGDDLEQANNSLCKISSQGIEYYENLKSRKNTNRYSVIAIIISLLAFLLSTLTFFSK
nr:hypothetical protein [Bacteroidota bacterium]